MNRTNLKQTIGILPPEARGCNDIDTVKEMANSANSHVNDPALDKSRCYGPEDIRYVNADGVIIEPEAPAPIADDKSVVKVCPQPSVAVQRPAPSFRDRSAARLFRVEKRDTYYLAGLLLVVAIFAYLKLASKT